MPAARAVAIFNAITARIAELPVGRGALRSVIGRQRANDVERSRDLINQAFREHTRRLARAIDQRGGG